MRVGKGAYFYKSDCSFFFYIICRTVYSLSYLRKKLSSFNNNPLSYHLLKRIACNNNSITNCFIQLFSYRILYDFQYFCLFL